MYVAGQQSVLSRAALGGGDDGGRGKSLWLDERVFPAYIAAASLAVIALRAFWTFKPLRRLRGSEEIDETDDDGIWASAMRDRVGGTTIFACKIVRLLGTLVLFLLVDYTTYLGGWKWVDVAQVITLGYASILALFNTFLPTRQGLLVSRHMSLVTVALVAVYAYRDIWPLMTFTLVSQDGEEGSLLWVKLALATVIGVVEPVFEPYPYMPYDPTNPMTAPNPEQTASIISFLTYVWLEPTIWRAYRVQHLPHSELPPLCDYDEVKNLIKRSYPSLDPFSGAKKGSLFWGLVKIFRCSLIFQAILLVIYALGRIAVPIGTNRLLAYLEGNTQDAVVKPWVWILWLGLGPLIESVVFQLYTFLSTGSLVRTEAIITSLVFDHALRIRLEAEAAEKKTDDDGAAPGAESPVGGSRGDSKGANTPDTVSDEETAYSLTTTNASAATSSTATVAAPAVAKGKSAQKEGKKEDKKDVAKKGNNLVGRINNLVTSDLDNITGGRDFLFLVLLTPLTSALSMWFLYEVLGWSAFVGMAVMIALLPVSGWVAKTMNGVQNDKMKATDARVESVTEVMNVLRMIKLFGWETRVGEVVSEKRENELDKIWKRKVLQMANNTVNFFIPLVHMLVTFAVYTTVMKNDLTASIVFSSMAAFELLRGQVYKVMRYIPQMITAKVSLGRVADFLQKTELLDAFAETSVDELAVDASAAHVANIGFGHASFSWTNEKDDGALTPSRQTFRLRIDDEVKFKPGAFNLIVGPTGSGKTSVLMTLLGEMHYIPSGPGSWVNLPREDGVAYAAQESWVLNETIKQNILFGAPYNEERYKKVIYQCGLTRDLSMFDSGDATEVGEKGLTLSGGQKARVTLARAVYSSAKILLLDDVLAALDVHTARWIVNKCFKGDLVRGRTVLLVTHNVGMAAPLADFVISLHDGRVNSQGSVKNALASNKLLAQQLKHEGEAIELDEHEESEPSDFTAPPAQDEPAKAMNGKLVIAEEIEVGHVSWKAFSLFLASLAGKWPTMFWSNYLVGGFISECFNMMQLWWLGYWARQYSQHSSSDVNVIFYLLIYLVFVAGNVLTWLYAEVIYTYGALRAARAIHSRLVQALLGCTFRWLDITPTSRVIARCTQDIQAEDGPVATKLGWLAEATIILLVKLIIILTYTPIFLLPAVFVATIGAYVGNIYIKAQLSIKREMSVTKAPILAVFGSAMTGLTSIRAYGAQGAFKSQVQHCIDRYIRAARPFYDVNRWVSTRLDALGQMFIAALAFYLVYGGATNSPSSIGFVLTTTVSFSEIILFWIRTYNELEVSGNSLERIQQYIDIDQEPEPRDGGKPPAYWPSSGDLRAEGLSARYSVGGPMVLQDISFHVKSGERIGIVGRTGSGKSTLTLALLRCIYTEGKVFYDGIPTDTLNLDALRSKITIIPQVPELLSGSLRHNLDLFGQYDDVTLNDALRTAGLFSLQRLSDENRITLDTEITGGGGNLSVGQRQIIALARAIVRQSKLLILDEATSAIDYETDAVLQSSLRTELKSDVTVITVAHRLQTIMDYDKIMVLDAGRLVEFDSPAALLKQEDSLLRALVEESSDKEVLYAMAERKQSS